MAGQCVGPDLWIALPRAADLLVLHQQNRAARSGLQRAGLNLNCSPPAFVRALRVRIDQ